MVKQLNYVWLIAEIITKYIEYINRIHGTGYSFYNVVLVKFYCDVIARSHLQLINTLFDTFFSKIRAFLAEQRRPMMVKRKLDGAV